jgi:hypothetical protein
MSEHIKPFNLFLQAFDFSIKVFDPFVFLFKESLKACEMSAYFRKFTGSGASCRGNPNIRATSRKKPRDISDGSE